MKAKGQNLFTINSLELNSLHKILAIINLFFLNWINCKHQKLNSSPKKNFICTTKASLNLAMIKLSFERHPIHL